MKKFSRLSFFSFKFSIFIFTTSFSQEVEEVVVTATKKDESIQDIALSIEAFTAEDIEENMIEDLAILLKLFLVL